MLQLKWTLVLVHRTGKTVARGRAGQSGFRLSARITLKDVGRQHSRVRGFAEEPTVIEVPLDLQEDQVPAEKNEGLSREELERHAGEPGGFK